MSAVRNDYARTFLVAAGNMVLTDDHQTGKLSMGTGKRVEREFSHACDCRQCLCKTVIHPERTLHSMVRLKRMKTCKSRMTGDFLVDLWIVLHGTATKRIESRIHTEVHLGKIGIMTHYVKLAYLRQCRPVASEKAGRDIGKSCIPFA